MVLSVYLSRYLRAPEPKKPPFWGSNLQLKITPNPPKQCQIWIAGILGLVCGPLSSYWDHAWFPSMALAISHHTSCSFTHSNARSSWKSCQFIRYLLNTYVTLSPHFTIFMNPSTVKPGGVTPRLHNHPGTGFHGTIAAAAHLLVRELISFSFQIAPMFNLKRLAWGRVVYICMYVCMYTVYYIYIYIYIYR